MVATKGTGKSRFLGRGIAWRDLMRGHAQVVFDPAGGTIDNFLDKLVRRPPDLQRELIKRIVYIDLGNRHAVVPLPLYFRLGADDGLQAIAQRYLETVRMLDPNLQSAAVEGWNALSEAGTKLGMVLAAVSGQVTDAPVLFAHLKPWQAGLQALAVDKRECQPAVDWLLHTLMKMPPEAQVRRTAALMQKLSLLTLDGPRRAMFGASQPGLDWQQVIAKGQTVLLDFRHVHDVDFRRFLMLWVLIYFIDFIKYRGIGRWQPIGLLIDEVSVLTNLDQQTDSGLFATLLDELLNVYARQSQVWVTISHQEVWQVSPKLLKTLMGCGTRIMGRTSDAKSAMDLAEQLFPMDPYRVKRHEPIFDGERQVVYQRPVGYNLDEQRYAASRIFQELGLFEFLMKSLDGEGGRDLPMRRLWADRLDPGDYPDDDLLKTVRANLHRRTARRVATILDEIDQRQAGWLERKFYVKQETGATSAQDDDYDEQGYRR